MTARPVESLLQEAQGLLQDAESHMGAIWRTQFAGWTKEAADWVTGYQDHQAGELTEVQLDPGVEGRVSNLEQGLMSLALSVVGLQTLALQGVSGQQPVTRWTVAQDIDPEAEVELLDGSKIQVKDVPIDPKTGMPEEEWAMKHCPCPTHEEKRSRKAAAEQQPGDPATGMYL